MEENSIYGPYEAFLPLIMKELTGRITAFNEEYKETTGHPVYEHFLYRIKEERSMREKCARKGFPVTTRSALRELYDAVGLRIITRFLDDVFRMVEFIRTIPGCTVVMEKDYINNPKPNGYRSYHMILDLEVPYEDVNGHVPGHYYAEVQLRTLSMDSWASLEHEMKYKQDIQNTRLIVNELKRLADEMASCDISMQTISDMIRN